VFTFIFIAIFAPIIAPIIPKIAIGTPIFQLINLFFFETNIALIEVGIKKIKLVACAVCCSTPKN
jgi:hypothetical protein